MGNSREYPQDIFSKVATLERQVERLELASSEPSFGDGTISIYNGDIIVEDSNGSTIIGNTYSIPGPTSVVVTTGTTVNESWAKLTWVAPVGVTLEGYEIASTVTGQGVVRTDLADAAALEFYVQPLQAGDEYSFQIRALGRTSNSAYVTATPNPITIGADTSTPNTPTGFQLFGSIRSVYGIWNANTDYDVAGGRGEYELQVDVVSTFNSGNQKSWKGKALIGHHTGLLPGINTYYARLRVFDSSGNASAWTATLSTNTQQAGTTDVADGTLVTNHFITGTLHAGVLTVGTLNGDRLIANTADIAVLKTGSFTSQIVTIEGTAMLRVGRTTSPFHYLLIDPNGIRAYKDGSAAFTGGTTMFETNTQTGSVSVTGVLTGTFQTAGAGQRVSMGEGLHDQIKFYTGDSAETNYGQVGSVAVGSGSSRYFSTYLRSPLLNNGGWAMLELRSGDAAGTASQYALLTANSGSTRLGYISVDNTDIDLYHEGGSGRIFISTNLQFLTNSATQAYLDNAPGGGTGDSSLRVNFVGIGIRRLIANPTTGALSIVP